MKARSFLALPALVALTAPRAEPGSVPVRARNGMVVSQNAIASQVGAEMLLAGGNAVDAAVATAFALAVVHPAAGNLGGGGFLLLRPATGPAAVYDFREQAPAAATPTLFLRDGTYSSELHHDSAVSVGVPGTVAGLNMAWADNGRLPWKDLLQPAISLAREGFMVSDGLARSLRDVLPEMVRYPASIAQFSRKGVPYETGDLLQQPDLARTLERIAEKGARGFYTGETAELIEKQMKSERGARHARGPAPVLGLPPSAPARHLPRRRGPHGPAPERGRRGAPPVPQRARGLRRPRAGLQLLPVRAHRQRGHAPGVRRPRALPRRPGGRQGHAGRAARLEGVRGGPAQDDPRGPGVRLVALVVRVAGGELGDDAPLGGGLRPQCGRAHHHARGQLRLEDGRGGRRLPAQQRDGRLQRRAGAHRRERARGKRAEPRGATQAHAVEHDADDRGPGGPPLPRDREPRGPHDPEHGPPHRAERPRLRDEPAGGGRRPALQPPVAAGRDPVRALRALGRHARGPGQARAHAHRRSADRGWPRLIRVDAREGLLEGGCDRRAPDGAAVGR